MVLRQKKVMDQKRNLKVPWVKNSPVPGKHAHNCQLYLARYL